MAVSVLREDQDSETTEECGEVVGRLVTQVSEDDEIEEGEDEQVGQVHLAETVVDRLPTERRQEVPSFQLAVDVPVHEVFLLLLGQLDARLAVFANSARLPVDVLVEGTVLCLLKLRKIVVSLLVETVTRPETWLSKTT